MYLLLVIHQFFPAKCLRWIEGTLNRLLIVTENEECMGEAKSCIQGA
jgi:hypothetical protein